MNITERKHLLKLYPILKMRKVVKEHNLPFKYNSHTGRCTVTTLAMMTRDEDGNKLISPEMLEFNNRWMRGSQVLGRSHNLGLK